MKGKYVQFVTGIIIGAALVPTTYAAVQQLTATPSTQRFYVDGKQTQLEAYAINGNNYVKLRDIGEAVGFNVGYDGSTNSVYIGERPAARNSDTVQIPTDGSKYIPQAGDRVRCDDGYIYEVKDVRRYDNNVFADGPVGPLPNKIVATGEAAGHMEITVEVTTPDVPVYLTTSKGTVELKKQDAGTPDDPSDDFYVAENIPEGRAIIAKDDEFDVYDLIVTNTETKTANVKILPSDLLEDNSKILGLSKDGKRIDLYTGWTVTGNGTIVGSTEHWSLYTTLEDCGDKKTENVYSVDKASGAKDNDVAYFPDTTAPKLYIVPTKAGIALCKTDETKVIGTEKRPFLNAGTMDNGLTKVGIWEITVNSDFGANDVEALVAIDEAEVNKVRNYFNAGGVTSIAKGDQDVFNYGGGDKYIVLAREIPGVEATFTPGKDLAATGAEISVEATIDDDGYVNVTLNSTEAISKGAAKQELGTIYLKIGDIYTIELPVALAKTP